ncbi:MAG: nucleotide exchange factor GrpE, partial [Chloroflexales bacterium]|nr:nucleotide exchange factor GrpE [Chloroflexales bacterium]
MTETQMNPNEETPANQEIIDVEGLQARIEALEKEVSDLKDAYLRATADYKNLKRRYDTERIE